MADYYELLGVGPAASAVEIRKAYTSLAREKHPDRFRDAAEKEKAQAFFQELTTAFNTLINPRSREEYDASRLRPQPTTPDEIARDAFERAQAQLDAGDLEGTVTLLRTATHNAPGVAEYHAALGRVLGRIGSATHEARAELTKATELEPQNPAHFAELALLYHRLKQPSRAQTMLQTAQRLGPSNPRVLRAAKEIGVGRS